MSVVRSNYYRRSVSRGVSQLPSHLPCRIPLLKPVMLTFVPATPLSTPTPVSTIHAHHRPIPLCLLPSSSHPPRLLVLGATGRVATSTLLSLFDTHPTPFHATLVSRTLSTAQAHVQALLPHLPTPSHTLDPARCDITNPPSLRALLTSHHLVLHTAGPFQHSADPTLVLRECISARVHYIDVCDDLAHAQACRQLEDLARQHAVIALISTGIYPGVSNLMASRAARRLACTVESIKLYYHTAGSGGIGATVLASTFLLLGEQVLVYDRGGGARVTDAGSEAEVVDFGGGVRRRVVYLLNLPEVVSLQRYLAGGKALVCAKFGTTPRVWNVLLRAMARWVPDAVLRDRQIMTGLARFSMPVVRAVDAICGARTAILVKVEGGGKGVSLCYEHSGLERGVGEATAAFVREVLEGGVKKGVWFPEELEEGAQERVLERAVKFGDGFRMEILE